MNRREPDLRLIKISDMNRGSGKKPTIRQSRKRIIPQPSSHFSYSEINALPLNGQQAVTAISALWLRRSTAFRWLQQPIGRHLMIDVVEQVIERHQEVKNEGISEALTEKNAPKHLREIVKYMTEIFTRLMIVIAPATMLIGK